MRPEQGPRRRPLDGLRAVSVLAVFACHVEETRLPGGWVGVEVFFVLSGYLITSLLLAEHGRDGRVSLRRFYRRRALRLYPALIVALLLGASFSSVLGDRGTLDGYLGTSVAAALYLQDFVSGISGGPHGGFGHTWSLAVEEQFYLLWPPVLLWTVRRGGSVLRVSLVGAGLSLLAVALTTDPSRALPLSYFLPWSQASVLLTGCALAVVLPRVAVPTARLGLATWAGLGGLALLFVVQDTAWRQRHLTASLLACALLSALVIAGLEKAPSGLAARVLGWRPLAALGLVSYGFYLFHVPVITVARVDFPDTPHRWLTPCDLAITLALSVLSYRLVERPLQRRFGSAVGADPQPRPA